MANRFKELSDGLGDDRDLAVLDALTLAEPPSAYRRRVGRDRAAWQVLGPERPAGAIDLAHEPADLVAPGAR
jgi:hypothetical protein